MFSKKAPSSSRVVFKSILLNVSVIHVLLQLKVLKTLHEATAPRLLSIMEYCRGFGLFTEIFRRSGWRIWSSDATVHIPVPWFRCRLFWTEFLVLSRYRAQWKAQLLQQQLDSLLGRYNLSVQRFLKSALWDRVCYFGTLLYLQMLLLCLTTCCKCSYIHLEM